MLVWTARPGPTVRRETAPRYLAVCFRETIDSRDIAAGCCLAPKTVWFSSNLLPMAREADLWSLAVGGWGEATASALVPKQSVCRSGVLGACAFLRRLGPSCVSEGGHVFIRN